MGPLGFCTANTPLRDSSLAAKAPLETVPSVPVLAAATIADEVAAMAEVVPDVPESGVAPGSKADSTSFSPAAMLFVTT